MPICGLSRHSPYHGSLTGCKAFPPGEHFTVPAQPDVASVNALGGLNIAADRLAIIDGQGWQ